ncbi:MAG: hypothetical protein KDI71_12400 [Xanthomonadales bacterium]|nr:hypothetical protein [Xanthomonadales bacterium]
MKCYSWNSDGELFTTVAGVSAEESVLISPYGRTKAVAKGALHLRTVQDERGVLPLSDFPHTGLQQPRVLSQRAWDLLGSSLEQYGDVVGSMIEGVKEEYFVWFPNVVIDCLDDERTQFIESLSAYRRLLKPVFLKAAIESFPVFVVKGFENQDVWVHEDFRQTIMSSGLLGSEFRLTARCI